MTVSRERELNPLLRRADWRFLLGMPRPLRAFSPARGPLADAVAAVSAQVTTADPRGDCDLAAAESPDRAMLDLLFAALRPGGACYTEWRSIGGRRGWIIRALREAGFAEVVCYRPWPAPPALPVFWIPLGAPGAEAWARSRRRLRGGRVRRLLAAARQRGYDLARGRLGATVCVVARRPGAAPGASPGPSTWLGEGWSEWGLGPPPGRLSTLLVTGGPRTVSKAVLLAFAEPGRRPALAVKWPRVPGAMEGVRREATVLEALGGRDRPGVPRLLFQRELDGVPLLGETALPGRPLEGLLSARTLRAWSLEVTDWLAALRGLAPPQPAAHRQAAVESALARFSEQFGAVVDQGLLREGEAVARTIGALPVVPEQRDFGPWNILVMPSNRLGVLDWESAEPEGLPALDLLYFLAHASFAADRARDRDGRVASYRRSLDPGTRTGAVRRECLARYLAALGIDPPQLRPLRALVWLMHTPSEFRHGEADAGGPPPAAALERSLFLALWSAEVRRMAEE